MKDLLAQQEELFNSSLSFIPSENYSFYNMFGNIYSSDIANRYSFKNNPFFSQAFPGHNFIHSIEGHVEEAMCDLFQVKYLTLNPLSGMHALTIVLSACTSIGDTIFTIPVKYGGHPYTTLIAERLGLTVIDIEFERETQQIDYVSLAKNIISYQPRLIYIDQMNGLYNISLLPIRKYLGSNTICYYDVSHNAAFIAAKDHIHPLDNGYDIFGGSLHKSFPGPKKGFIGSNQGDLFNEFIKKASPFVSHNSISEIAILGKVIEKMSGNWESYVAKIHKNVDFFAQELSCMGFKIISGTQAYSHNHQLFFIHDSLDIQSLFFYLESIGVFTNLLPIPFCDGRIGIRMGFQEFSFLGGSGNELRILLKIILDFIGGNLNIENHKNIISLVKKELLHTF